MKLWTSPKFPIFLFTRSLIFKRNLHVKSIAFSEHGDPKWAIKLEEKQIPDQPKDDSIIVEMFAAAINRGDIAHIRGDIRRSLPNTKSDKPKDGKSVVAGSEGIGTVTKVGKNVKSIKAGDWVIPSFISAGTWTTHMVGLEKDFLVVPQKISQPYGAMLGGISVADQLLTMARFDGKPLQPGDVIIQNGANGAVGVAVLQLAYRRRLKSINIVRTRKVNEIVVQRMKHLGGYIVCPYEYLESYKFRELIQELPKPKLALNGAGGASVAEFARLLHEGGSLITYGSSSGRPVQIPSSSLIYNDINLKGFWLPRWLDKTPHAEKQQGLNKLVDEMGGMQFFANYFLLDDFPRAIASFFDKERDRRILLTPKHLERPNN